jgi:transcriptional regulator GlxA family with amidase domain
LLGVDDLLIRVTLLLLVPSLRQGAKGDPDSTRGNGNTRRTLGHLTDWIDDNLHQAIGLTDLERTSGYSRRTLQYSFKTHYGCTPMQWVKQRRLKRALQRLEHPEITDTVWSVAQAHGYSNLAAFSRDFKAKHGRTASEVLRNSRSSH